MSTTPAPKPKKTASQAKRRRRRRRYHTAASRLAVLLLVLAVAAGAMYALLRLVGGDSADAAQPSPRPTIHVAPTAPPAATPEPTPALPNVDVNSWQLRLVRYEYPLGEDFVPPSLMDVGDGQQMDSRVAPTLLRLIEDAKAAGNSVWVCSGYRDYATQYIIYFDNHVNVYMAQGMTEEEANAKARLAVNYPGTSEHQYGLSVDLLEYNGQSMEPYICTEDLMVWLDEHCAEYGFVIRYPDGKTDITGVEYEPWHLRYVGPEAAAYMMEHDLCLEEFLELYQ